MGETGCGKTRLIRYMCEIARQALDVKNMFILKVWLNYCISRRSESGLVLLTSRFMVEQQRMMSLSL